ncbi:MAG: hypothetical protein JAZ03_21055, partial [Candidatus Thiodiazotropha taylori]|nr:hypothetical protein [Candidatus Thiodiazotropha taylori]MCW4336416.1 hypothetical protein [Candidatus Thiodiazotropha endolucinida]
ERPCLKDQVEEDKPLKMGTLNVKNIDSNAAYVRELLEQCHILAIQEHWLFNFQLHDLDGYFSTHFVHSKAVDDDNPLPPPKNQEAMVVWQCCIARR